MTTIDARDFGRMEGKLDQVLEAQNRHSDEDATWHAAIDARLRKLEQGNAHASGRSSVFSLIGGSLAGSAAAVLLHMLGIKPS